MLSSEHASPMLWDAIIVLALSGMRVEELARLKVGELRDLKRKLPYIGLQGTKTQAALRDVPIHPNALPIILRRAEGKSPDAYLFDELPTPSVDSAMERGQPITKAFGRLRQRLGIDERVEGQRQANVDLHSLRRWFIAKARDAINAGAQGPSSTTSCIIPIAFGEIHVGLGHAARGSLGCPSTSLICDGRENAMEARGRFECVLTRCGCQARSQQLGADGRLSIHQKASQTDLRASMSKLSTPSNTKGNMTAFNPTNTNP